MRVPLLSFFTGGGFLDMGFEQEDFRIVWTNENNPAFVSLYEKAYLSWRRKNRLPKDRTRLEKSSIEDLTHRKILSASFRGKKPALFGVIGGPPCPDFSHAGRHKGHKGINGKFTEIYVDLLCEIKPVFFVLENVSGLARKRHRSFLNKMKKRLETAGYAVDEKILNALEFGVPQFRERLFVVGVQKSFARHYLKKISADEKSSWFPWPKKVKYPNAVKAYSWPERVKRGQSVTKPKGIPEDLFVSSCLVPKRDRHRVSNANHVFNSYSDRFYSVKEGDTSRKSFKRLHRYRFSPTACYGNNEVHLHPWEPRRLSLREAMRIQGIPESYVLPKDVALSVGFKMVSNGVPVPLGNAVARSMKSLIANVQAASKGARKKRRKR